MTDAAMVGLGVQNLVSLNLVTAGAILLIWWLTHKAETKRWTQQRIDENLQREMERKERETQARADREERKSQAAEHMAKWESMMDAHQKEVDRLTRTHKEDTARMQKLLEREVQVSELHAAYLNTISNRLSDHKICPKPDSKEHAA